VLPAGVIVNPTEIDAAQEAIKALSLSMPVANAGGCLLPEIWLEIAEEAR